MDTNSTEPSCSLEALRGSEGVCRFFALISFSSNFANNQKRRVMGKCKYCGKKAGFLSSIHKECEELHTQGLIECKEFVETTLFNPAETSTKITDTLEVFRQKNFLSEDEIRQIIQEEAKYHRVNSTVELNRLRELSAANYLTQKILDENLNSYSEGFIKEKCKQYFDRKIELEAVADSLATYRYRNKDFRDILLDSLNTASRRFLEDGVISDEERSLFNNFVGEFGINIGDLPSKYADSNIIKVKQLTFLKDLQNGEKPNFIVDAAPVILTKGEFFVWVYKGVTAYEERTKSEWVGRSGGASIRICKGVYYHVGQSKGHKVSTQYMAAVGTGFLMLTNKNIIFYSRSKSIKVAYKKIIALQPYSDGVEIQRETSQKRLVFSGFDSWFIMNLLSTLEL
ncbi:hypothetical protein PORUE0001_0885 [Porphyromonas uenonis 60-3]|uniref:Uncharacterized protein n=2 Tax=Porphyromonas uenonis TaxID=281920 RepID=C2MDK6_9PORP|nr:hypothetical protein PORUE0001_0885 [Porphyromonas uenonis 60-3]